MKPSRFVKAIIKADADYFLGQSFISQADHTRTVEWLNGTPDKEIQVKIVSWLRSDSNYLQQATFDTCRLLWFIWPIARLACMIIRWQVDRYAKELGNA